jgi:hypothetical protein
MPKPLRSLAPVAAAIIVAAAAIPAAAATAAASDLAPETLAQAQTIRTQVTARYRLVPGRKLVVTEATTMAVVDSLTLLDGPAEPRIVPTANGIYFAICASGATCPYPTRARSWPEGAHLPRQQALELALRTFLETTASLVVVGLPTARPVWVVFERDDLLASADGAEVLGGLAARRAVAGEPRSTLVDRLTRPRLFVPLPVLPPSRETILAAGLFPD